MNYPFRSALVTGASSGIGEVMARQLLADGITTVLVARRGDRLQSLASEFPHAEVLTADLSTDSGRSAVTDRITNADRPVDLVVNNAGSGSGGLFHELDPDRLDAEIALNVTALTRLSHAAMSVMVPRGRGWLLNVSSIAGFQATPRLAVYAATKAYVTALTEALHTEVAGTGVRVTALCPGLTRTEFQRVSNTERFERQFPEFAWTSPDQVARDGLAAVVAGRAIAVPGMVNKVAVSVSSVTPRIVSRAVAGLLQRDRPRS